MKTTGTKTNEFFASDKSMSGAEAEMLNEAVKEATAFPSYKAMRVSMEGGYVPTLREFKGKGNAAHNRAIRIIREHLNNRGWPHFSDGVCVNY